MSHLRLHDRGYDFSLYRDAPVVSDQDGQPILRGSYIAGRPFFALKELLSLPNILLTNLPADSIISGTPDDETIAHLTAGSITIGELSEESLAYLEVRRQYGAIVKFLEVAPLFYPPRRWG